MKKQIYTIENMKGDLLEIIRSMNEDNWSPDIILAIGRGGYIPGVYISHWLNKPLHAYHYSLRDLERRDRFNPDLIEACSNKKVLVIDDICDVGSTFASIKAVLDQLKAESRVSCLIYNIGEKNFEPNYWGTEINKVENPVWISYPWENWWHSSNDIS